MSRFLAEDMAYMDCAGCLCNECRYVEEDGLRCGAFPDGIPVQILSGKRSHKKKITGDHGIRFKPRKRR